MDAQGSFSRWWAGIPAGTRFILSFNVAVYVVGLCTPRNWSTRWGFGLGYWRFEVASSAPTSHLSSIA
eukprot:488819-Hanusia_phi.AAC.1